MDWDTSYEIVLALKKSYPEAKIESIGLQQLFQMIVSLPDFEDDPALVNDTILETILREWYEEVSS